MRLFTLHYEEFFNICSMNKPKILDRAEGASPTIRVDEPLFNWTLNAYSQALDEVEDGEDFTVKLNTPGGNVLDTWGFLADIEEKRKAGGKATLKIRGMSASMGLLFSPFFDYRECLDVSTFLLHRTNEYNGDDEEAKAWFAKINNDLYQKLKPIINDAKLKEIKGVTLRQVFNAKGQKDYIFSAKEAKAIGLVDKIVPLGSVNIAAESSVKGVYFFDNHDHKQITNKVINQKENNIMTKETLQKEHPEVYNAIFGEGVTAGETKEKERVSAWMAWDSVDPERVAKGIKDGEVVNMAIISDLSAKAATSKRAEAHKSDNVDGKTTETKEAGAVVDQGVEAFAKAAGLESLIPKA